MPDIRPPLGPAFSAFGVAAIVTPPGGAAVPAYVVVGSQSDVYPAGGDISVRERRMRVSLRRSEVPSIPRGTTIQTAAVLFTVDAVAEVDDELIAVLVY
jgi:hypothetical protein